MYALIYPGEFSFRKPEGNLDRSGSLVGDPYLMLPPLGVDGFEGKGEFGNDLSKLADVVGLRVARGDFGCESSGKSSSLRSESELRLFFLGGPVGMKLGCSPIVERPSDGLDVDPGEVARCSRPDALRCTSSVMGRPCKRPSPISVEWDRCNVPREMLLAGLSPRVLLLKVRQTADTFESCSDLLFSLDSPPKPNFFLRDDVFELSDPVLADLDLLCPSTALSTC